MQIVIKLTVVAIRIFIQGNDRLSVVMHYDTQPNDTKQNHSTVRLRVTTPSTVTQCAIWLTVVNLSVFAPKMI